MILLLSIHSFTMNIRKLFKHSRTTPIQIYQETIRKQITRRQRRKQFSQLLQIFVGGVGIGMVVIIIILAI